MKINLLLIGCTLLASSSFSQNVGIGTSNPDTSALLHIDLGTSTAKGFLVKGVFNASSTVPNLGGGSRMLFYPGKAAFRVGYCTTTQWDNVNIGSGSSAFGFNNIASGTNSTAWGYNTSATGNASTAFGNGALASGDYSHASGYVTTANGLTSTAMGANTIASGTNSTAMGSRSNASGSNAAAMGDYCFAKAYNSLSIGAYNNISDNPDANLPASTDRIFQIGNGSYSSRSNAMTVFRDGSVGIGTISPIAQVHIYDVPNNGFPFFVESNNPNSSFLQIGSRNNTSQVGLSCYRSGLYTGGIFLNPSNDFQLSLASYGTVLYAKQNGNIGLTNNNNPNAPLAFSNAVGKKISLYETSLNSQYGFAVQSYQLQLYTDGPAAKISFGYYNNDVYTERMFLNNSTGILTVAGTNYPSDARYKKQIKRLQNPLQKLMAINGVEYFMKLDEFPLKHFDNKLQVGLIAQEVEMVLPQAVQTNEDGYKSVDYARVVPLLVEAIKDQQQTIDQLKARLDKIENSLHK